MEQRGLEAFQENVKDVHHQLGGGLLRTPRELEITLIQSGRVRVLARQSRQHANGFQWKSQSPRLFNIYQDAIITRCDEAMKRSDTTWQSDPAWRSGPAWRNRCYVADLHEVFALSWDLDKRQTLGTSTTHWPNASVLAVICPRQPDIESPLSSVSVFNQAGTISSSPTSRASWTSASGSQSRTIGSSDTSPTVMSQMSTSPTIPALKSPATKVDYCQPCGQEFTGSPQNRRSNMLRHFRDSFRHNKDAGLRCPQQDCERTTPMRSDNLRQHLQKVHGLSSQAGLQDALRRSKRRKVTVSRTPVETSCGGFGYF